MEMNLYQIEEAYVSLHDRLTRRFEYEVDKRSLVEETLRDVQIAIARVKNFRKKNRTSGEFFEQLDEISEYNENIKAKVGLIEMQ